MGPRGALKGRFRFTRPNRPGAASGRIYPFIYKTHPPPTPNRPTSYDGDHRVRRIDPIRRFRVIIKRYIIICCAAESDWSDALEFYARIYVCEHVDEIGKIRNEIVFKLKVLAFYEQTFYFYYSIDV